VPGELVIGHSLQVLGKLGEFGGQPGGVGPFHAVLPIHVLLPAALQQLCGPEADPGVVVADQFAEVELRLDGRLGGALPHGFAV
jgi:hypothetical protein